MVREYPGPSQGHYSEYGASESISPSIIAIFGSLLAEVAKRATELHDPKLDSLMLRLNLYECEGANGDAKNKWRVKMIDKMEKMA